MTNSTFDRYNFTFDSAKFGDANILGDNGKQMMINFDTHTVFNQWQKDDLANGPLDRSKYYKNPVFNASINLSSAIYTFGATMNSVSWLYSDSANAAASILGGRYSNNIIYMRDVISKFVSHTNNVSGVSANTATEKSPTLDSILSVGNDNALILYQTDKIANSVGGLGSMTSLFVESDLNANTELFNYYTNEILNNTTYTYNGITFGWSNTCNLLPSEIEKMNVAFRSLYSFVFKCINDDWFYYQTSINVQRDYQVLTRFSQPSNTQTYLINNYIGTDFLKEKLAANT
jgi:hypothetical protein